MIVVKTLRQSFKFYRDTVENPIKDKRLYLKIVEGLMIYTMEKVREGYDVDLGSANTLGTIGIRGRRHEMKIDEETGEIKGLMIDWVKTKKLRDSSPEAKANREVVYHLNEHSNGITYHYFWSNLHMKVQNKTLYTLTFVRHNTRAVSNLIKAGKEYTVKAKKVYHEQTQRT